jgi:hypothetical protein
MCRQLRLARLWEVRRSKAKPAVAMLNHAGIEVSALGIARHYQGLIDGMVIDDVDAAFGASHRGTWDLPSASLIRS